MKSFKEYLKQLEQPMIDDMFWLNESLINESGIEFIEIDHVENDEESINEKDNEETEGFVRMTDPDKKGNDKGRFLKVKPEDVEKYEKQGYVHGWRKEDSYYKSFAIQTGNSKLGFKGKDENGVSLKVANFSLPPITTCRDDAPCKKKCYAIKAYRQYPGCAVAWDKNLELLQEHPDWLERDLVYFFKGGKDQNGKMRKGKGSSIKKFRWMVSGDLVDRKMLDSINRIAEKCNDVLFWLYTKRYEFLKGFTPTSNLKVIVSAWNDFMIDTVEDLHKKFPVAYLDDTRLIKGIGEKEIQKYNSLIIKLEKANSPKKRKELQESIDKLKERIDGYKKAYDLHKSVIPSDAEAFICPCSDDKADDVKDGDYYCSSCRTHVQHNIENGDTKFKSVQHPCYALEPGESLIFRIH